MSIKGISTSLGNISSHLQDEQLNIPRDTINNKNKTLSTRASPVTNHSTTSKIAKSIGAGLLASGTVCGTCLTGIGLYERIFPTAISDTTILFSVLGALGASVLTGVGVAAKTYRSLSQAGNGPTLANNNSKSSAVKSSTLAKVTEALKAGWIGYSASISLCFVGALAYCVYSKDRVSNTLLSHSTIASALAGVGVAAIRYRSLSQNENANDRHPKRHEPHVSIR